MSDSKARTRHSLAHLRIEAFRSNMAYSPPSQDMSGRSSGRNRAVHGPKLERELAAALAAAQQSRTARDPLVQVGKVGVYLEVESAKDEKLPDLSWSQKDIRLGAVRATASGTELGTLFVPDSATKFFTDKVNEYAYQNTPKNKPKHEDKFAPVEAFRLGTVDTLWTDQRPIPPNEAGAVLMHPLISPR